MKKAFRSLTKKDVLIPLVTGAVIAAAVVVITNRQMGLLSAICDGCFVAGVLLVGWGGLVFARNEGQFDIFSYGIPHWLTTRWPGLSTMPDEHRNETLADYRIRKKGVRKSPVGHIVAGLVYLLIAGVLLAVYFA